VATEPTLTCSALRCHNDISLGYRLIIGGMEPFRRPVLLSGFSWPVTWRDLLFRLTLSIVHLLGPAAGPASRVSAQPGGTR
jgi:hypothetical protein